MIRLVAAYMGILNNTCQEDRYHSCNMCLISKWSAGIDLRWMALISMMNASQNNNCMWLDIFLLGINFKIVHISFCFQTLKVDLFRIPKLNTIYVSYKSNHLPYILRSIIHFLSIHCMFLHGVAVCQQLLIDNRAIQVVQLDMWHRQRITFANLVYSCRLIFPKGANCRLIFSFDILGSMC